MRKILRIILFLLAGLIGFYSCQGNPAGVVVIGSKIDTEGAILGYLQLYALRAAGVPVEDRLETGPTLIVRQALLSGELDSYIEYTGTALVNFKKENRPAVLRNMNRGFSAIAAWDSLEHGLIWLPPWSGINNTYTVLMRRELADSLQLQTISQLTAYLKSGSSLSLGSDPEFAARPDGLPGLLSAYGITKASPLTIHQMDAGLVYQTLQQGSIDAAIGYSTDGRIRGFDLVRLEDDLRYFPVYTPAPVYRRETLKRFPQIRAVLTRLAGRISADDITEMNYRHDVEHIPAHQLAREWLKTHRLSGK